MEQIETTEQSTPAEVKKDRKARNAELKAAYEAEQAEKKARKEAAKAAKVAEREAKKAAKRAASDNDVAGTATAGVPAESETTTTLPPLFPPAVEKTAPSIPETSAPSGAAGLWEAAVTADPVTKREKREDRRAAKLEKELASSRKKKGSLPGSVQQMLIEKRLIVARWRSRRIEPERAVEMLTALSATDENGSVWRLLPRNGGAALVRTTVDGLTEIIEPPRKKRPFVAFTVAVLFGVFAALAIWSSFDPVTSSGSDAPVSASSD